MKVPVLAQTVVLLTLSNVFMTFDGYALYYMNQPLKLDYVWASLCIMGAVYFIFRA